MRARLSRLVGLTAGIALALALVLVVTEQRTQAQDLTTLLAYFLRQLYAGTVDVGGVGDALLVRDAAATLAQKNGTTAQEFRVYGTTTGPRFLQLKHDGSAALVRSSGADDLRLGVAGNSFWYLEGSSGHLKAITDNTNDIGAVASGRPKNLYVAGNLYGNGGTLTGITGATGGVSNTGSTTVASDSDNSGGEDIAFYTSTVARWFVKGGTGMLVPNVTNTYDIGTTSLAAKTTYTRTLQSDTGADLNVGAGASSYWKWQAGTGHFLPQASATYDIGAAGTIARFVYSNVFSNGTAIANAIYSTQVSAGQKVLAAVQNSGETSGVSIIDLATTWNNGANTPTAIKLDVLDTASNASSLLMDLKVGGVSKFNVYKNGTISGQAFLNQAAGAFYWSSRSQIQSPADGVIALYNAAATDFTRLQFGGTSASFPALKRVAAELDARLADDSGYAAVRAYAVILNGGTTIQDSADGVLTLSNGAGNNFTRLNFGPATNLFPALKRSTTVLQVRLADDSTYGSISADYFMVGMAGGLMQFGGGTNAYPALKRNSAGIDVRLADDSGFTTIQASTFWFNTALAAGGASSSTGAIRLANATYIGWRNAANSQDIIGLYTNASDAIIIGNGNAVGGLYFNAVVTPASTGTRYICIDTAGKIVSSATACSGT